MKKLLLLLLLLTEATFAASFDCDKASNSIETAICEDSALSSLDEELATTYAQVLAQADTASRVQLKTKQRQWITQVRNRCSDTECLSNAYRQRIDELGIGSDKSASSPHQTEPPTTSAPLFAANAPQKTSPNQPSEDNTAHTRNQEQLASAITEAAPASTQMATTEKNLESVPAMTESIDQKASTMFGELSSLQIKLIFLMLALNAGVSIYLHKAGKLVIYADYTDASFTSLSPLLAICIYLLLSFLEVPAGLTKTISLAAFSICMLFVVKSTADQNHGLSLSFFMALLTKLSIIAVYYGIMFYLFFGHGNASRKKGESQASYEARRRRERKEAAALMASTTAGFTALSAWICKESRFSPINEYLAFSGTKKSQGLPD